jgi:hypothetical protein
MTQIIEHSQNILTIRLKESSHPTELILGSTYFLLKTSILECWEVWLTPERSHFQISMDNLSLPARKVIDEQLPRFADLFSKSARRVSPGNDWNWFEVSEDICFIPHPNATKSPVNAFCVMGNWVTLAGPCAFPAPAYPWRSHTWGWLRDVNVPFVEEILEMNFVANEKPWLSPQSFDSFLLDSSQPCQLSSDFRVKHQLMGRLGNKDRVYVKQEQAQALVGQTLKATSTLDPFGNITIDSKRFDAYATEGYVNRGDLVEVVGNEGIMLLVKNKLQVRIDAFPEP